MVCIGSSNVGHSPHIYVYVGPREVLNLRRSKFVALFELS